MPHVWCLLSLFPLIGSKGHRKHNDVQRPLIRCDKHNHIKNAQKSWEVQSCTPKIFGVHGLSNQGLAKKEKIQHLWKYGSLHMDVTCTSMKASLMLDDKNILWCNIDREAHLKETKPNHTPHIPAASPERISLCVHHEDFCPECCCQITGKAVLHWLPMH